jgi:hypothetical protein
MEQWQEIRKIFVTKLEYDHQKKRKRYPFGNDCNLILGIYYK